MVYSRIPYLPFSFRVTLVVGRGRVDRVSRVALETGSRKNLLIKNTSRNNRDVD